MSFKVLFVERPAFLHAVVTGTNTKANVTGYLEEILRECLARRAVRVLIEERLEGPRLGVVEVFDIAADGSGRIAGIFEAIAYVDVYAAGGTMKFAETVAVNRGAPVRNFGSVTEAERWLSSR
jgi:hypothetical protein